MPLSIRKISPLAQSFIGALLLHVLCYLVWGMYYSEFSDRFFTAYVDGSFSGGITKPIFYNYGFFTGISHLMAVGYDVLPQFNWYGIFGQAFMVMATTGFLWLQYVFRQSFSGSKWLAWASLVFLLPFWAYHIVLYRTTELAFLACGISILGLVVSYMPHIQERMLPLKPTRRFLILLLLLAVFIRLEPTLMCTAIFLPYGLWVVKNGSARLGMLKTSFLILPIFAGAYALYLGGTGPAEKLFRDTRVYTHTLWDFGQDERLFNLTSPADSVKLEAADAFFISDEAELSPEFYQRIGVIPLEKSLGSLGGYLEGFDLRIARAVDVWEQLMVTQPIFFIAYDLALFFALGLLAYNKRHRQALLLLALQLWLWAILFGVTVFMKMELRVFAPLITLGLITLTLLPGILLSGEWIAIKGNRIIIIAAAVFSLMPAFLKVVELKQTATLYRVGNENINRFKSHLKQPKFADRIVVFHSFAWQLLYGNLFDNNEFARNTNFLAIDNGEMYMYPQFKQAMTAQCGGYGVDDIARYLVEHKSEVVFVSDLERMELMQRYIETVYAIPFAFHDIDEGSILSKPDCAYMMPSYAEHLVFSTYALD